jgi:spermidine synthase
VDAIQQKLERPEYATVAQSLREIGMNDAIDLFSTFAGRASDLKPWLADATINTDRNLRLQFLAGMGFNLYQSDVIYSGMLAYAGRYPDEMFVGSPETIEKLRAGIRREQGR